MSNVLATNRATHSEPLAPKLLQNLFSRRQRMMFRYVAKDVAALCGAVLVMAAIIAFRSWMWLPRTLG